MIIWSDSSQYADGAGIYVLQGEPAFDGSVYFFQPAPSLAEVYEPAFLPTSGGTQLLIAGVPIQWQESTLRIERTLGQRSTASFRVYRPFWPAADLGALPMTPGAPPRAMQVFVDNTLRFSGVLQSYTERSIQAKAASFFEIKCQDYQSYTDRAIVAKLYTVDLGGLLSIIFADIVNTRLAQFGITYVFVSDPGVVVQSLLFHYISVTEAFNRLCDLSPGYSWWIDENKVAHFEVAGSVEVAPFDLDDAEPQNNWDEMTVAVSDRIFRNRQWVLPSNDVAAMLAEDHIADGTETQFLTTYAQSSGSPPVVWVWDASDHVEPVPADLQQVTEWGVWTPGFQWFYFPDSRGIYQDPDAVPIAAGLSIRISYPSPFPLAFYAEDAASILDVGLYEVALQAKDVTTQAQAETAAAGLLDLYSSVGFPEEVNYAYNSARQPLWVSPAQSQQMNTAYPKTAGEYILERVVSQEQELTVWRHSVTARTGNAPLSEQVMLQSLRTSARVTQDLTKLYATWELAVTVNGISNPGLATGEVLNRYVVQSDTGVISRWDSIWAVTPPVGADMILDIFLNGDSIFGPDDEDKIVIPDGTDTLVVGYQFRELNIQVVKGDILTMTVLQVGSETRGSDGVVHLLFRI